jgi:hypothetical protein
MRKKTRKELVKELDNDEIVNMIVGLEKQSLDLIRESLDNSIDFLKSYAKMSDEQKEKHRELFEYVSNNIEHMGKVLKEKRNRYGEI